MDLRQLECFLVVAEERNFTRAARRLNLVQSGLSRTIRLLEEELGGALFVRNTRRVDPTPAGKVLIEEAQRVLGAAREARLAVTQVNGLARGQLRLGSMQSLAPFVDLPVSLGRFRGTLPGIDIELRFDGAADLLAEVDAGRLDVVFTQPGGLGAGTTMRMLACEDLVLITAPGHPLAGAAAPELADLAGETFVDLKPDWGMRRLIDRSFARVERVRRTGFEVNDVAMVLDLVAEGLGVALVPESIAATRVADGRAKPMVAIDLGGAEIPCWEIVVAFRGRAGEPSDRITRAFLDHLHGADGRPVAYMP